MRWEDSRRPCFQHEFQVLFPVAAPRTAAGSWKEHKCFVTMYKQRRQSSSMSNHIHPLIPPVLSGHTQTPDWPQWKPIYTGLLWGPKAKPTIIKFYGDWTGHTWQWQIALELAPLQKQTGKMTSEVCYYQVLKFKHTFCLFSRGFMV